ncbi:MAG: TonB-dependent receptor [Calditrichaeota bacterium]|nr:TonB-dependent receptor [Calditrichota bacterium]RQW06950.1 MAG: TonB-dependent receptor [Calditrichota bacterium]
MVKICLMKKMFWESRFVTILSLFLFSILSFHMLFAQSAYAQESAGKVIGKIVDSQTGDDIIGANIYFEGTSIGAASDLDGTFLISTVPPGTYTLTVQMISYAILKITDFKINAGEVKKIELTLQPEALTTEEVVVEARMVLNNEASLLKERQRAIAVSDAISSEAISRSGSSTAADAMSKVTGASVVDGKYVYIRGMGERYSATMLNGAEIPSADPEKKAVQMDMFPSNLLDNIIIIKTFTPDKPGNFSGGMVDVGTKGFPDKYTMKFSFGTGYNSQVTFNTDYLTYPGSNSDWLGRDDGYRDLPEALKDAPVPANGADASTRRDPELANQLDKTSKAFEPFMSPVQQKAPVDKSASFSVGNQTRLLGRPIGYLASLSYKQDYSFYDGGQSGRWQLGTDVATTDSLNPRILLNDTRGSESVLWGGLFTASSKIHDNHEISANVFYTQSGESSARYLSGNWPEQFGIDATNVFFETRVLSWVERNLQSYQLSGEHYFQPLFGMKLDWQGSLSRNTQNEPDIRYFSNHYAYRSDLDTTLYSITPSNYPQPARYFRELQENGRNGAVNMALPFSNWNGNQGKIKLGGFYSEKDREFTELRYQYERPPYFRYAGDANDFFSDENTGIIDYDSTRNEYRFGNFIQLSPDPRGGDYRGDEKISAAYGMIEIPLTRKFRFIGGTRFESTRMNVSSPNTSLPDSLRAGSLNSDDWLPSVNMIYQLTDNMNIRLAYGRTLARPTLREMAPYSNFEFVNDYAFTGNINLNRTLIDNYDVRWEWFDRPGEIYAVSGFYKLFYDPIERTIIGASSADNPEITYVNVSRGTVLGLEFEARKRLDVIHRVLNHFHLGFNLSLVHSQVDIPQGKLDKIIERDPERQEFKDDSRPLQGQSPHLLNLDFGYDNYKTGTTASIQYNVFGDRLSDVTSDATPDVYEKSRDILNFIASQKLFAGLSMQLKARNILNSSIRFVHEYKGVEYVRKEYKIGREFSIGISYDMF